VPCPKTEQGLERSHWLLPPVVAKDEFIQVGLKSVSANAMMSSQQPLFQVADGAVGQRHCGLRASM
jgi:hypothetical protein